MLRGFTTISYWAADHDAARRWYTDLLGVEPYFNMPGYCEFRIGDYQHELGIVDSAYAPPGTAVAGAGVVTYWHVDDVAGALETLLAKGATLHDQIRERGSGFVTASVVDPFGNLLGVMYNPHYLEVLAARSAG